MSKGKSALGRGLGALLPADGRQEDSASGTFHPTPRYEFGDRLKVGRVADLDIELIDPNPYQPRQAFDEGELEELAASIRQLGIIQPITVRSIEGGRYQIISGERRVRASRRAGLSSVPAYVREADTEEMLEMALVENVQRAELNPIEVAIGYQRLIDECGLIQEQVADKVGKNRATVANFLRLLRLPAPIQAALRDGTLSVGHARAMIPVDDERTQRKLLARIVTDGLSVRAVEDLVREWHRGRYLPLADVAEPSPEAPPEMPLRDRLAFQALTDRLRSRLGTKVAIKPNSSGEGGRIEVAYFSNDDLERLIELLGS